jgi:hypothetical protein
VAPFILKKWAITSPTSGGRLVGIVRSRTQAMEFVFCLFFYVCVIELGFVTKFMMKWMSCWMNNE